MIDEHIIRSDLPDKQSEPELYEKVIKHQIHTCSPQRCGGPSPPGQQCKPVAEHFMGLALSYKHYTKNLFVLMLTWIFPLIII